MSEQNLNRKPNPTLTSIGIFLLVVATAGYFFDKNEALTGGFLLLGLTSCVFAVFATRLEGTQEFSLTKTTFNLNPVTAAAAEKEIEAGGGVELSLGTSEGPGEGPTEAPTEGSEVHDQEGQQGAGAAAPIVLFTSRAQVDLEQLSSKQRENVLSVLARRFNDGNSSGEVIVAPKDGGQEYRSLRIPGESKLRVIYRPIEVDEAKQKGRNLSAKFAIIGITGYA